MSLLIPLLLAASIIIKSCGYIQLQLSALIKRQMSLTLFHLTLNRHSVLWMVTDEGKCSIFWFFLSIACGRILGDGLGEESGNGTETWNNTAWEKVSPGLFFQRNKGLRQNMVNSWREWRCKWFTKKILPNHMRKPLSHLTWFVTFSYGSSWSFTTNKEQPVMFIYFFGDSWSDSKPNKEGQVISFHSVRLWLILHHRSEDFLCPCWLENKMEIHLLQSSFQ